MIVLGKYSLDDVLPFVSASFKKERKQFGKYLVKVSSQRLLCFQQNHTCVTCGREGSYFNLEYCKEDETPHFNLYSTDGILMTKDHIFPKSKGGENKMYNYQTMCQICNVLKDNKTI